MDFFFFFAAYELTGLSRGGQQVNNCSQTFNKAVKLLVELASLQVRYFYWMSRPCQISQNTFEQAKSFTNVKYSQGISR